LIAAQDSKVRVFSVGTDPNDPGSVAVKGIAKDRLVKRIDGVVGPLVVVVEVLGDVIPTAGGERPVAGSVPFDPQAATDINTASESAPTVTCALWSIPHLRPVIVSARQCA
jgi:hypothetical protein